MPIHDYRCRDCGAIFELLVFGSTVPACRSCGGASVDRQVSLTAPQGNSREVIAAGRRAAAREGHFSHYSKAERGKLGG